MEVKKMNESDKKRKIPKVLLSVKAEASKQRNNREWGKGPTGPYPWRKK